MSDESDKPLVFRFGLGESECDPARTDVLGGKGASLAAMSLAGFPVPPGFTISAACCEWAEQHGGEWPAGLAEQVRAAMSWLEEVTDRTFGREPKPLFVAVRSGAAVSMPGMMDTILNCGSDPAIEPWDALCQAINAVFASWHSDRARAYRQHHDVRGVVGTAVNVQAMFASERSGVLFTANPNDPAANEMLIEASWGLGEAVVSGAVTPDIYVLDAATLVTKRIVPGARPGNEPALTDSQILELAELGRRVESHFQTPSDIEWGIADGRVALMQTRKIRGLELLADIERGRLEEIARLRALTTISRRGTEENPTVWVVHNLSETLPAPTPLTWDLVRWFMSAAGGYGQMYRLLGLRPQEREPGLGFLELIAGRVYVDPRRAAEFHFGRLPFDYDLDEILRDRTAIDRPPTRFNFDRTDSLFFFRCPAMLFGLLRGAWRMKPPDRTAGSRFENVAVPKLNEFLTHASRVDLSKLSTPDLLAELRRRRDFVLGEFAAESLLPGFFGGLAHERLRALLTQLFGQEVGEQLVGQLTTGLANDITVEQNFALFEVAAGRQSLDDFLQRFGHRAANEMELSQSRWREDHDFVTRMVERFRGSSGLSPRERHAVQVETRRRAESSLPTLLAQAGGSSFYERIVHDMRIVQELLPYREVGKFHLMRGYETLRAVLVELGRRWDIGRDVFFLHEAELPQYCVFSEGDDGSAGLWRDAPRRDSRRGASCHNESDLAGWETRIAHHKLRWQSSQKLSLPDLIDSRQLDDFGRPRPVAAHAEQTQLECRPIASGAARGVARIVFDPSDVSDLGSDAILVCPSTDPGWTPLFIHAKGLIVERGGVLSHGAIIAREFGIPAVVLEAATQLIPDGATIELDANRGLIVLGATR
ncbi:MAG: PEP/pyruvate-binding domain-containing protein [Planctomycetaceae bacterium]